MIAFVRECFPGAAVLLLGVSDRSVKTERGYEPMDAIPYLTACQRAAAERAGAAFWPVSDAMRSWGGMAAFVSNGWAGKDHTHINFAGDVGSLGRSPMLSTPVRGPCMSVWTTKMIWLNPRC